MNNLLLYLLQVSVCHVVFYMLYKYVFSKQTFFQSNRFYLLSTTILSFIIPLLSFEVWNSGQMDNLNIAPLFTLSEIQVTHEANSISSQKSMLDGFSILEYALLMIYFSGASMYAFKLFGGMRKVARLILHHEPVVEGDYKIIRILKGPSFFSFWKYIFINEYTLDITHEELQQILSHEKVHVRQRHTIDILLMEIVGIICWFNPFVRKIKRALCQTHEFIADGKTVGGTQEIESYSRLILRLSSSYKSMPLTHQFSMINIKNRITMLHQSKQDTMKTYKLLLTIPVILLLMSVFSCTDKTTKSIIEDESIADQELTIGEITWEGNTKFSDAMLTRMLGADTGDKYNKEYIRQRMMYHSNGDDISSMYMDNGHLFFSIDPHEEIVGNTVNLNFIIYEGGVGTIDKIAILGNAKVVTSKIMDMVEFKQGELFSRSELIQSQKNIAESGFFNPDSIGINPIPHEDDPYLVDIEFTVIEL